LSREFKTNNVEIVRSSQLFCSTKHFVRPNTMSYLDQDDFVDASNDKIDK
jgi:acid phosphatase class B